MKRTILSFLTVISSASAMAAGNFIDAQKLTLTSPSGVREICRIPRKIAGPLQTQSAFDKEDLEEEAFLCKLDFYKGYGVCPKFSSTNPGVQINKLEAGMTKSAFEASHCGDSDEKKDAVAKFKQSITCSYTPSGLAYYQISRLLGGVGRVPVAVARTMDRREHMKIVEKALEMLPESDDIRPSWVQMSRAYENGATSGRLFTADGQIYGFLAENPKREEKYTEVSGIGSYETRYPRFLQQPPFLRVANKADVPSIAGTNDLKTVLPIVTQMKDVSDMILMDTLLSQQDRIGNIHYKFRWYYVENGKLQEQKSKARRPQKKDSAAAVNYHGFYEAVVPEKELKEMLPKGGFLVKEMIMKDNDCGVDVSIRQNMMRQISALEQVRHMSPKTYTNFMNFAKFVRNNSAEVKEYFMKDLLFTESDFEGRNISFLSNLEKARSILLENCKSGLLKLDLERHAYLPGAAKTVTACE